MREESALAVDCHSAVVLYVRQLLLLVLRQVPQTLAVFGARNVGEKFSGRRASKHHVRPCLQLHDQQTLLKYTLDYHHNHYRRRHHHHHHHHHPHLQHKHDVTALDLLSARVQAIRVRLSSNIIDVSAQNVTETRCRKRITYWELKCISMSTTRGS